MKSRDLIFCGDSSPSSPSSLSLFHFLSPFILLLFPIFHSLPFYKRHKKWTICCSVFLCLVVFFVFFGVFAVPAIAASIMQNMLDNARLEVLDVQLLSQNGNNFTVRLQGSGLLLLSTLSPLSPLSTFSIAQESSSTMRPLRPTGNQSPP